MKTLRFFSAAIVVFCLSGCSANNSASTQARDVLKTALNARAIGRTFDAGVRAIDSNDVQDLGEKCDRLRAKGASREADLLSLGAAENAVLQAEQFENGTRTSSTGKRNYWRRPRGNIVLRCVCRPIFLRKTPTC